MFITPSLKKSLIVEQFQRNYLKLNWLGMEACAYSYLYHLDKKGTPYIYHLLQKGTPFIYLHCIIFLNPGNEAIDYDNEQFYRRTYSIYRLLHRKCFVRIFIHSLPDFGKRTSERSSLVRFPKSGNE